MKKLYVQRWQNAVRQVENLIGVAAKNKCGILFDGCDITIDQIVISEDSIYVKYDNCKHLLYVNDSNFDEGAQSTIKEFNQYLKELFILYIPVKWGVK